MGCLKGLYVVVMLGLFGCSTGSPEKQLLQESVKAVGGASRISGLETVRMLGTGSMGHIGQNRTPDSSLRQWDVTGHERSIDLINHRWQVKLTRVATFPYTLPPTQQQHYGIDGDVAYTYNFNNTPIQALRESQQVARERQLETFHHPLTLLHAFLSESLTIIDLRQEQGLYTLEIEVPSGGTVMLSVDAESHLPVSAKSRAYHVNLGDVVIETSFENYADSDGLVLPTRLVTRLDSHVLSDLSVKYFLDSPVNDMQAPEESVKKQWMPPVYDVKPERLAKGIWLLPGGSNSVVFEFDDHLKMLEVPLNEAYALAVIVAARSLSPDKPLTHAIVSHHHFDHSGGLRAAVSEGLIIVSHAGNRRFVEDMITRPHTLLPDALSTKPREAMIETVDDQVIYKDNSMELHLYHLKESDHSETMLIGYVPSERMLIQADLYSRGARAFPSWETLQKNIDDRELRVEKHLPLHGVVKTAAEVAQEVASVLEQ